MRAKTRSIVICAFLAFAVLLGECGDFKDKFEQYKNYSEGNVEKGE